MWHYDLMWHYKMRYMMKQVFLVILLAFGFVAGAQNVTVHKPKKQRVENSGKPRPKPRPKSGGENSEKLRSKEFNSNPKPHSKPTEAAGYDVTFTCNVPSALLSIDGVSNGTASGTRFLKTGMHSIQVTADNYVDYSGTFAVNSSSRSVSVTLQEVPNRFSNGTLTVNGIKYNMVWVDGGTFRMGATSEQGSDAYSNEKPVHRVTLSGYYIGKTEVTQVLWEAVMGSNPSSFKGDNLPVESVSWDDCQEFIRKLNSMTGQNFRLPTEAEWEFACRGGNNSRGYKYSGSNYIDNVAWHLDNSCKKTHPVATKTPNELGIYDMSGNVWEWCNDWYGDYSSSAQTNPKGPYSGSYRVSRGGSWGCFARDCRSSLHNGNYPANRFNDLGLRLALVDPLLAAKEKAEAERKRKEAEEKAAKEKATPGAANSGRFTVRGVSFEMVRVDGGTFRMGATSEQGNDAASDEIPVHSVTLSGYYIGKTEVTQALWKAVMGSNPSSSIGDNLPVECVNWDDCQEFIRELNSMTGQNFRLPTEAEWEFACRGGNNSRGYKYSGSNNLGDVAWYVGSSGVTHPVGTKAPNELGIYDMSGNVCEWCSDRYDVYSRGAQTNPKGPYKGSGRVIRGGGWISRARDSRSSFRDNYSPTIRYNGLGLRLAL